jgi:hypothetical protein
VHFGVVGVKERVRAGVLGEGGGEAGVLWVREVSWVRQEAMVLSRKGVSLLLIPKYNYNWREGGGLSRRKRSRSYSNRI